MPLFERTGRHHVGMAGECEQLAARTVDAALDGPQVRHAVRFDRLVLEAERGQAFDQEALAMLVVGRHGRARDQLFGKGEGAGHGFSTSHLKMKKCRLAVEHRSRQQRLMHAERPCLLCYRFATFTAVCVWFWFWFRFWRSRGGRQLRCTERSAQLVHAKSAAYSSAEKPSDLTRPLTTSTGRLITDGLWIINAIAPGCVSAAAFMLSDSARHVVPRRFSNASSLTSFSQSCTSGSVTPAFLKS